MTQQKPCKLYLRSDADSTACAVLNYLSPGCLNVKGSMAGAWIFAFRRAIWGAGLQRAPLAGVHPQPTWRRQ